MTVNSENLVFVIHRTHDMLKSCEDKVFGEYGLTTEQYAVLTTIKFLDGPVRITDLARRLTRSPNSISMRVDRMVKAGLLIRERDGDDRREVHLAITSMAESLLKPATLAGQEFIQKTLSQVSDEQALIRLLETVQREVGAHS